jgi:hypothetical protein
LRKISVLKTLGYTFSFFAGNGSAVIARIFLPVLVGWCVLYVSAYLYLSELLSFLGVPSDRSGSLVLGLVAAGFLALLLLHAMLVMGVTTLAMHTPEDGRPYFRAKRREWRLYAATLRILLVGLAFVAVVLLLRFLVMGTNNDVLPISASNILIGVGLFALTVRCLFLAPAIVAMEPSGPIVRRAENLSRGNFFRIATVAVILIAPGVAIETIGEAILRGVGVFPAIVGEATLSAVALMYSHILPEILVLVTLAYVVSAVLVTIASTYVYRELVCGPSEEGASGF